MFGTIYFIIAIATACSTALLAYLFAMELNLHVIATVTVAVLFGAVAGFLWLPCLLTFVAIVVFAKKPVCNYC